MRNISQQPTPLRCEVVSEFRRLQDLSSEWTRLWKGDPQAEIFQTPEWAAAWWCSFGHTCTLCSLVVFAEDEVIGIVPLVKRDGVIRFLGTPEADYADIVCEEKWAEEVLAVAFKTLRESVTEWSECVWQHLSKDSRVMRHYRALPRQLLANLHCLPAEPYQTILFRDNRDAVFSALLEKKHTRRRRNKLQKAGRVQFREVQTQQGAGTYLNDFFHHHVRRHAAIGRQSVYAAPESCQFIRTLFAKLGPAARFGVLELDGRPLAWYLGFQVNGKFLLYQHTFDLDASDFTPGELLLWNLFEYARDHVAREFDFGKGSEPYKDRFANHSRETFSLFIEPLGWKGRTRSLTRSVQTYLLPSLREIKQTAKSHRTTLRAFRSIRKWVLNMRGTRQGKENDTRLNHGVHLTEEKFGNSVGRKRSADAFDSEAAQTGDAGSEVSAQSDHFEPRSRS
jgi:CelD/BcsL family acetyltransferase involved in cellulose biosynthesis